jgi:hypothetical protein
MSFNFKSVLAHGAEYGGSMFLQTVGIYLQIHIVFCLEDQYQHLHQHENPRSHEVLLYSIVVCFSELINSCSIFTWKGSLALRHVRDVINITFR